MGKLIQGASTPGIGYDNGFVLAGVLSVIASVIGFCVINPEASKRRFAARSVRRGPVGADPRAVLAD